MKKGFTLAEVLITLGIIGVVAAMTLPALTGKYKRIQTVAQLKKVYSSLLQSVEVSKSEYGDIINWDWSLNGTEFFKKYLSKNLKTAKICGQEEGCWDLNTPYTLSGGKYSDQPKINNDSWSMIKLADGTLIAMEKQGIAAGHIHLLVDINGFQKPGIFGIDIFTFTMTAEPFSDEYHMISKAGLYMYGQGLDREELKNGAATKRGCTKSNSEGGLLCGALILMDGWQIKDDYPW